MKIATQEIRQRALAAHEAGQTQAQIAKCYGIDIRTFQRWLESSRKTGRTAPLPRGHNPAALDEAEMRRLGQFVQESSDATLEQIRAALGKTCSVVAIHNALKRLGYRFKKNSAGQRTRSPRREKTP
jgi:transposase